MKRDGLKKRESQPVICSEELLGLTHCLTVLKELRSHRISKAIEYLEFSIDCNLSTLGDNLDDLGSSNQKLTLSILKLIKDYRKQYPRKVSDDLLTRDLQDFDISEITAEAAKILKSL
jgi:hypothetical protein